MQSEYKWHSKFGIEKIDVILEILQDLKEEIKELDMQCACLQEESWQYDRLWENAVQFIREKDLKDEYDEWIRRSA
ncbi:MAG: hypothetical protein LUG27_00420 [Clostridiales bacterium]|nr:hypothetical protein [Clostridiales bacterium]